ncbi:MAG: hypothetical protein CL874_04670 [Dehalococcoidales bacterium]|nr:hypothetical protein [Dehalococcoidales bacterium]
MALTYLLEATVLVSHIGGLLFLIFTFLGMAKVWQERWALIILLSHSRVVELQIIEGEEGNLEFLWECNHG